MFRLAWFVNYGFGQYGWGGRWSGNVSRDVGRPELFMHNTKTLENAGFDYVMLEDAPVLPDVYKASPDYSVEHGIFRLDPFPLVPLIAQATDHIGVIATMTTSYTPPYQAARLTTTLDHLTNGRFGVNLVTSSPHAVGQNFGRDSHYEHDLRYEMADEWIDAVRALWDTWEPDAVVMDEHTGLFADPAKVHYANYNGQYHRTRGPLNTIPGPQHHPVICQAGGSGVGRTFAARNADTVMAGTKGIDGMRGYRDDITRIATENGRDASKIKVVHLIEPVLGDTMDEAKAKDRARQEAAAADIEGKLAGLSYLSGIDMSQFDLDAPLPDMADKVNGHKSSYDQFNRIAQSGKTFREALSGRSGQQTIELVGTPEVVADQMEEAMEQVGGDGFLFVLPFTRKNVAEVADGLAPVLRRRGVIRDGFAHKTFKENLQEF
ncbi:LLM class flavin-dependent oxidoreductase [Microbacterium paludicola]|uniref:LLM class flavin-dependent oxidoreductase n=1 Tax=Microbacterium paludicola TaxID=300019 RepID=A0A4Y9FT13_9MICO|nr:NtaA/DmoA family FMN-dependent monooxygenase [Microbacterium paludicola]MBF0817181.1 NtaA/DmoA family FMN-dependent monooxygenase [Microbacterium paludicola]TFU32108.1 LLM class flavin-dependent oxidoreductase [Microbacterium paludicola]